MAERVPGWLEKILLPQLSELKGDVRAIDRRFEGPEGKIVGLGGRIDGLNDRIDGLEDKIDGLDGKMEGQFAAVHAENRRLDGKVDMLGTRMDVSERLAVVEGKIRELEAKN